MKEVRRLNLKISEKDMNEILPYFEILHRKRKTIKKTYNIEQDNYNYIINLYKNDLLGGKFIIDIYEIKGKIEKKIFETVVKVKEDLYSVFYKNNHNYEIYFRIDVVLEKADINEISSYVLNRFDSVNNLYKLLNVMTYNDFNNDFELAEFCVLAIKNVSLLKPVVKDFINQKLNYYGYDEDFLPVDINNMTTEFIYISTFKWNKSNSKEILNKIIKFLILELNYGHISKELSIEQINSSISTLYGMYIYSIFNEHVKS